MRWLSRTIFSLSFTFGTNVHARHTEITHVFLPGHWGQQRAPNRVSALQHQSRYSSTCPSLQPSDERGRITTHTDKTKTHGERETTAGYASLNSEINIHIIQHSRLGVCSTVKPWTGGHLWTEDRISPLVGYNCNTVGCKIVLLAYQLQGVTVRPHTYKYTYVINTFMRVKHRRSSQSELY